MTADLVTLADRAAVASRLLLDALPPDLSTTQGKLAMDALNAWAAYEVQRDWTVVTTRENALREAVTARVWSGPMLSVQASVELSSATCLRIAGVLRRLIQDGYLAHVNAVLLHTAEVEAVELERLGKLAEAQQKRIAV